MRKNRLTGLSDKVSDIVLVAMCTAVMLIVAYPLYYVLIASISDPYDVYAGKTFLLPSQFTLRGYESVFADKRIFNGYMNSIKYTVIGTIFSTVMVYITAYPLAVKSLPGRKWISIFFLIWAVTVAWLFPLQSRFENSIKDTIKNAVLCGLGQFPRSLLMSILNLLPWVVLLFLTSVFFEIGFLWISVWFGLTAYLNMMIIRKPFFTKAV